MTPNENHRVAEQIAERTCKFCNAAFTTVKMTERHEKLCAKRSPEQRAKASAARNTYRNLYSNKAKFEKAGADARLALMGRLPKAPKVPRRKRVVKQASVALDSKRVQITLSLDWDTLRRLLITIAPDVSVDGIKLT